MCEIIIKRIPTHAVRSYDIAVCDPSWNFSLPHRFNKCHSLMPILATTGIDNYSVNVHLLETEVSHKINRRRQAGDHRENRQLQEGTQV
jgi:hypothetical protein